VRRVPVGSIDRTCARIPAVRIELDWSVWFEGRWLTVVGEPILVGDSLDEDGGRVRLLLLAPRTSGARLITFRRGERVWVRAPRPDDLTILGCTNPQCANEGPFELVGVQLWCLPHLADRVRDALLAETAGDNDEDGEIDG
jgi:hypothetical protein